MAMRRVLHACAVGAGSLVVLTGLAGAAPSSPGDLDSAFGSSGRVILTPGLDSSASSEAAQADGKIVLAGTVNNGPPPPPGPPLAPGVPDESFADFLAVRIAANGALDQSFGSGGFAQVPIDLGATNRDIANAVAVGPNGTVVLAGNAATSVPSNSFDSAVVRLTAEGDPDPSFAGDGIQTVDVGNADDVYGVAVQDDGKVVAVGGGSNGFTLFRLDTDGSLDPGFGTGGIADTVIGDPASRDQAMAVAVSVGGEIVVAGASDIDYPNISAVAMVRYLPNGQPDPTFGTDGIVVTPGPPGESAAALALAFQPDGKAVIGGDVGCIGCAKGFLLARYLRTGALDDSFGSGGIVTTSFEGSGSSVVQAVAVDSDGKIVAAGYAPASDGADFALARYHGDGSLDLAFSSDGKQTHNLGGGEIGRGLLINRVARRAVVAGGTTSDGYGHVAAIGVQLGVLGDPVPPGPPPPPPVRPPPPPPTAVKCRVPRVIHLRLAKARSKIKRAHCRVGRVRRVKARRFRGLVVAQSPRAGKRVARGTRVKLVLGR